ncbi:MAG: hypothetical protein IJI66_13890 [Erysipelotrichaceae bacterium]|nr:hypothetical protein [Erysipelotrichaceae bacterium]
MNKTQIRNEIERRISTYSDDDLFSSEAFEEIMQHAVEAVCAEQGRIPAIHCHYDPESNMTSCTQGTDIYHNTASPLIRYLKDLWLKYTANIGVVTHECLHVLFTDFPNLNKLIEGYHANTFKWYPKIPKGGKEVVEYCKKYPNYARIYVNEISNMVNILEDAYIENRGYEKFGGVCTAGLTLARQENYNLSSSYEELFRLLLAGETNPVSMLNALMMYDRLGQNIKHDDDDNAKIIFALPQVAALSEKVDGFLEDSKDLRDRLAYEKDGLKRCAMFNELAVMMFDFMPKPDENQDEQDGDGTPDRSRNGDQSESQSSGSGGSGGKSGQKKKSNSNSGNKASGNSESSDQKSQDDSDESQSSGEMNDISKDEADTSNSRSNEMLSRSGMSEKATGDTRPVDDGEEVDKEEIERKKQNAEDLSKSRDSLEEYVKKAIKEAVTEEVLKEDERQHEKQLGKEAKEIDNNAKKGQVENLGFSGIFVQREQNIDKSKYNYVYSKVASSSKALTRKIADILKDRKSEGYDSGYLTGQRFNATDVYHGDGKYFSREIVPDGQPNVVFGVLIDESGSMLGNKNATARKSAILLEDTLRNLGIPHMICGHNERYSDYKVRIFSYVDFDTNDGNDKYRLVNVRAEAGNVDGAAITYMAEKLLKRPEEIKVLIVISDGQPAGHSYYAYGANEDTMGAVAKYRKKDIKIFGTILDDYDDVAQIYGPNYSFDCRNGDSLQKELIKLIKKYVLIQ